MRKAFIPDNAIDLKSYLKSIPADRCSTEVDLVRGI
jgi:hypothetical protein